MADAKGFEDAGVFGARAAVHAVETVSSIEVRVGQTACALLACGAGVAIVDDLTARTHSGDKLGFRLLLKGPSFDLFAVTNPNFALSALAAAFVGHATVALKQLHRTNKPQEL